MSLGSATTLPAPEQRCSCCGAAVTYDAWLANPTRRPWLDLGLEIAEHDCRSTLARELAEAPAVTS